MGKRMLKILVAAFLFAVSAILWFMYYAQYFQWRSCFNEMGRCFDPQTSVVYHAQSGIAWLALAVFASALCVIQIWRVLR